MKKKLTIAHRGASKLARENTLQAFAKAIEAGADAIELDVRKTKDGILVVFHNEEIAGRKIRHLTCEKLNTLARAKNFSVPTLEDALKFIAGKIQVHIEIKSRGYETRVAELAKTYLPVSQFVIISFHEGSLKKIKLQYPDIRVGLVLGAKLHRWLKTLRFLLFRQSILAYVDFFVISKRLWRRGFGKIIPRTHPVGVWTVDDPNLIIQALKDERLHAITTNVPDKAVAIKQELYE